MLAEAEHATVERPRGGALSPCPRVMKNGAVWWLFYSSCVMAGVLLVRRAVVSAASEPQVGHCPFSFFFHSDSLGLGFLFREFLPNHLDSLSSSEFLFNFYTPHLDLHTR
jgi:hypothetical protein